MTFLVEVYDEVKYNAGSEVVAEVRYEDVKGFEVVSDPATVDEIESQTDASGVDDYHEYLILYFENGETATFRNSYVDLFRY